MLCETALVLALYWFVVSLPKLSIAILILSLEFRFLLEKYFFIGYFSKISGNSIVLYSL